MAEIIRNNLYSCFMKTDSKALFTVPELYLWTGYTYELIRKHSVLGKSPLVSLLETEVTVNTIT